MTDLQSATEAFQATLDARSALIDSGAAQRDSNGNLRATTGWDANEVIGKDGLAATANGITRLYYNEEGGTPWHRLGQGGNAETVAEALALAHIDGPIVKRPIFFGSSDKSTFGGGAVHNQFATVYIDPETQEETYLAVVGHRYQIIQPLEQASFVDEMLGQAGGLKLETAGALNSGRTMFLSLLLPENVVLDPEARADIIKPYVTVRLTHDGSGKNKIAVTPLRTVCMNTLDWNLKHATSEMSITHTRNALANVKDARNALGMTVKFYKAFEADANELIRAELSTAQVERFLAEWHPLDNDASNTIAKRVEAARDQARELYYTDPANANITGTAWGLLNALEAQIEHKSPVRPSKALLNEVRGVKTLAEDITRSRRQIEGADAERKTVLREKLLATIR